MKSNLFYKGEYKEVEKKIKTFLNKEADFLSPRTATSPRATGDAMQELLAENFESIVGKRGINYSTTFARRAMADLAFGDDKGFYYIIDVKTHRLDTHFNMPNLTSMERLTRFYEDDKNYFVVLTIAYNIVGTHAQVEKVHFVPIEFLAWDCLTLGALGWGQIQIANSNNISVKVQSRKKWMLELCDNLFEFYPAEIGKIKGRIEHFKKVRERWLAKKY